MCFGYLLILLSVERVKRVEQPNMFNLKFGISTSCFQVNFLVDEPFLRNKRSVVSAQAIIAIREK